MKRLPECKPPWFVPYVQEQAEPMLLLLFAGWANPSFIGDLSEIPEIIPGARPERRESHGPEIHAKMLNGQPKVTV